MSENQHTKELSQGLRGGEDLYLLWVNELVKDFSLRGGGFLGLKEERLRAVDGVSFDVKKGETFGLVGESGCGKSTIARCILQLTKPTAGEVYLDGTNLIELEYKELQAFRRRMQIVFQDPYSSLDPRMTIKSAVEEPLIVHKLGEKQERMDRVEQILFQVGITPDQLERKPHEFSGGQRQRIGIARSLILEPDLVILDEPVSALDVSIQAQILNLLKKIQRRRELTYLFIIHDLIVAEYFCDRLAVLYLGAVMELANRDTLFHKPLHPYTITLLSAVPIPDPASKLKKKQIILKGDPEIAVDRPVGCRFQPRCPVGNDRELCKAEEPALAELEPGHWVSCHYPGELSLTD